MLSTYVFNFNYYTASNSSNNFDFAASKSAYASVVEVPSFACTAAPNTSILNCGKLPVKAVAFVKSQSDIHNPLPYNRKTKNKQTYLIILKQIK